MQYFTLFFKTIYIAYDPHDTHLYNCPSSIHAEKLNKSNTKIHIKIQIQKTYISLVTIIFHILCIYLLIRAPREIFSKLTLYIHLYTTDQALRRWVSC